MGHRKIEITTELKIKLENIIENLIVNKNVRVFLFGSKSAFDDLCYDIVSKLKEKYADIKRVYVRCMYEFISDRYKKYLLQSFEETEYAQKCKGAGRLSYVKRNFEMIDKSDICVFYYNAEYLPPDRQFNHKSSRRSLRRLKEVELLSSTGLLYQ